MYNWKFSSLRRISSKVVFVEDTKKISVLILNKLTIKSSMPKNTSGLDLQARKGPHFHTYTLKILFAIDQRRRVKCFTRAGESP
jgi:hypothetical protein